MIYNPKIWHHPEEVVFSFEQGCNDTLSLQYNLIHNTYFTIWVNLSLKISIWKNSLAIILLKKNDNIYFF